MGEMNVFYAVGDLVVVNNNYRAAKAGICKCVVAEVPRVIMKSELVLEGRQSVHTIRDFCHQCMSMSCHLTEENKIGD